MPSMPHLIFILIDIRFFKLNYFITPCAFLPILYHPIAMSILCLPISEALFFSI